MAWLGFSSSAHRCWLQQGLSVPQQVLGTGTGGGDIDGSWAPGHELSRPPTNTARGGLYHAAALFAGKKGCFGEASACCELRLGSVPGCGSPRAGKAMAFHSEIFQMRCFDFILFF